MELNTAEKIASLAIDHELQATTLENKTYILHHKDYVLRDVPADINKTPSVTRIHTQFYTTASFCDYVNAFKTDASRIFFSDDAQYPGATCIIDYDMPSGAALRAHRAHLTLRLSDEWKAWNDLAAKRIGLTQEEFADFIEEHSLDIRQPSASDLYAMVTDMRVRRSVNWKKSLNLSTGEVQAIYTDEGDSGTIALPPMMDIAIPIFKDGDHYGIRVMLRYRISDGNMRMGIVLHRASAALNMALTGQRTEEHPAGIKEVIADATGLPVYIGEIDDAR